MAREAKGRGSLFLLIQADAASRRGLIQALRLLMEIDVTRPPKLYRYSERKWLERSLRLGEFRLRPASDYKDMESAAARTDDERHRTIVLANPSITHVRTGRPIIPLGDVVMSSEIATDYLTLCFAKINSDHFYQDFPGSDACLIIHDPNAFFNRVYKAIDSTIPIDWGTIDGPVTYGSRSNLGTPFMKPEKYVFQFEWRFACLPATIMSKCTALLLTIGSIEDIAEVVAAPAGPRKLTIRSINSSVNGKPASARPHCDDWIEGATQPLRQRLARPKVIL